MCAESDGEVAPPWLSRSAAKSGVKGQRPRPAYRPMMGLVGDTRGTGFAAPSTGRECRPRSKTASMERAILRLRHFGAQVASAAKPIASASMRA